MLVIVVPSPAVSFQFASSHEVGTMLGMPVHHGPAPRFHFLVNFRDAELMQ